MATQFHFELTDAALLRLPKLTQQGFQLALPHHEPGLMSIQRGDMLRIEGIPTDPPLFVRARAWTLMRDEVRLVIVLGLAEES